MMSVQRRAIELRGVTIRAFMAVAIKHFLALSCPRSCTQVSAVRHGFQVSLVFAPLRLSRLAVCSVPLSSEVRR
jgi:hypothetical protein